MQPHDMMQFPVPEHTSSIRQDVHVHLCHVMSRKPSNINRNATELSEHEITHFHP